MTNKKQKTEDKNVSVKHGKAFLKRVTEMRSSLQVSIKWPVNKFIPVINYLCTAHISFLLIVLKRAGIGQNIQTMIAFRIFSEKKQQIIKMIDVFGQIFDECLKAR